MGDGRQTDDVMWYMDPGVEGCMDGGVEVMLGMGDW